MGTKLPLLTLALAWTTFVGCASLMPPKSSQNQGASGGSAGAGSSFTDKLTAWFKGDKPKSASKPTVDATDSALSVNSKKKPGPDVNVALAQMAENSGNVEEAEKQYKKALESNPQYLPALLGLAHLKDRSGELEVATKYYLKATAANPQDARPFNDLGLCYHRRGMLRESVEVMQKAISLQPERKLYRNNLAAVLVDMNRPDAALEQLVAADGKSVGHYNLGYLLSKKGDNPAALAEFQAAAAADPGFEPAQQWIARLSPTTTRQDLQVAQQVPAISKNRPLSSADSVNGAFAGSTQRPIAGPATGPVPQQRSQLLELRRPASPVAGATVANSPVAVMTAPEPVTLKSDSDGTALPPAADAQVTSLPAAKVGTLQYPTAGGDGESSADAIAPAPPLAGPIASVEAPSDAPPTPDSEQAVNVPDVTGPQLGPSARRTASPQPR